MIFLVDLHTHFLCGIDDGAKSIEESISMLNECAAQGVKTVVATPHCIVHKSGGISRFIEKRRKSFDSIALNGKTPEIILGAEVYFDNDLSEYENINELCIGDTPYILIEFPMGKHDASRLAEGLYALTLAGLKPVIAHIDRYPDYAELIEAFDLPDIVYQINASRFLTFMGRRIVKKILDKVDFAVVSSDMHNTTFRKCNMKQAYEKAKKFVPDMADDLFFNNGLKMLSER